MEYISDSLYYYQYGTRLSSLNQCDKRDTSKINNNNNNLKVVLIILLKMCNLMDYVTNYNLYHVIWNQ